MKLIGDNRFIVALFLTLVVVNALLLQGGYYG
jgi:hypothetical protein